MIRAIMVQWIGVKVKKEGKGREYIEEENGGRMRTIIPEAKIPGSHVR